MHVFYERYLSLCAKNKLSPSAAATKAGFTKGIVSRWKKKYDNGEDVRPERDVLDKICKFFNCSEAWLLGLENDKKPADQEASGLQKLGYDNLSPENKAVVDGLIASLLRSQSGV